MSAIVFLSISFIIYNTFYNHTGLGWERTRRSVTLSITAPVLMKRFRFLIKKKQSETEKMVHK